MGSGSTGKKHTNILFKPFLKTRVPDLIQYNLDYVEKIKNNIIENGFIVDKASLFPLIRYPGFLFI